jgi:opacity protein-like surface antigen
MNRVIASLFAAVLIIAAPAAAQDKRVNFNLGAGVTIPLAEVKDRFGTGYNVDVGLTFNINPVVGIQVDYNYLGFNPQNVPVPANLPTDAPTSFDARHWVHAGLFDLVLRPGAKGGPIGFYALVGIGIYNRSVNLTTPSVGFVPGFCNPWWYVCYPGGLVPIDQVVGSRASTDMGLNIGAGINLKAFFVEARYHYIWGPEFTDKNGTTQKANGQYFPITFGLRF